jgi:transposase
MMQQQLKLKLTKKQEDTLNEWLPILTSIWNWAIKRIERDAVLRIYYTPKGFQNLLADTSKRLGIPSHTVQGMLALAYQSWQRCFKKLGKKPRFKGLRNKLNSIPFPDAIKPPAGNRLNVPGLGSVRFHKQELPEGNIKCGRIVKRASGWYLCLFIDAEPTAIPATGNDAIVIDPGFKHLVTFSTGEKVDHPRELQLNLNRLAQAQRGNNRRLAARLQERVTNQRKDRNHKLSCRLVSENAIIVFSKDNIKGIARSFGKSVAAASHGQLRSMLAYKCRIGNRQYIEVPSKNSTRICSHCGALTGPQGRAGLSVRQWVCALCGTAHDRDVNAAVNTLIAGVGATHEKVRYVA